MDFKKNEYKKKEFLKAGNFEELHGLSYPKLTYTTYFYIKIVTDFLIKSKKKKPVYYCIA